MDGGVAIGKYVGGRRGLMDKGRGGRSGIGIGVDGGRWRGRDIVGSLVGLEGEVELPFGRDVLEDREAVFFREGKAPVHNGVDQLEDRDRTQHCLGQGRRG